MTQWPDRRFSQTPNRFHHDGFDYRTRRRPVREYTDLMDNRDWPENRFSTGRPTRFHHDGFEYRTTKRGIPEYTDHLNDPHSSHNRPRSIYIPSVADVRHDRSRAGRAVEEPIPLFPRACRSHRSLIEQTPPFWQGFTFTPDPKTFRRIVEPSHDVYQARPSTFSMHRVRDMSSLAGRLSLEIPVSARRLSPASLINQKGAGVLQALHRNVNLS